MKNLFVSINKMASQQNILDEWYRIRKQIKILEEREKFIKYKIHMVMNDRNTNFLKTTYFNVTRDVVKRATMAKNNVPQNIWDNYSIDIEYPVLRLRKNKIAM